MYYWTRRCPQCGRELRKTSLAETLKCLCNWQWGNDVSKDSLREGTLENRREHRG